MMFLTCRASSSRSRMQLIKIPRETGLSPDRDREELSISEMII